MAETTRIVECVPNISEGRDRAVIDAVAATVESVEGCRLLDVDPGAATNRTVITFVGPPETVVEAAFELIKKASELIDMRQHQGEHPRFGATDVCPFVPVSGVGMKDCAQLARALAKRVGEELDLPVFLYEQAALIEERKNLSVVRQGEYEGLAKRLSDPRWKPDFGPAEMRPRFGALAVSAREFLLAYNVNINSPDKKLAHEIALRVREAGRAKRDKNWAIVRDKNGKPVQEAGRLKNVKGLGWSIEEYGLAQVSMNLTNFRETPLHRVFDACEEEAQSLGLRVSGSELVGLVPLEAMLEAGRHYLSRMNKSCGVSEAELVDIAIRTLGLRDVGPFDPKERIIEYRLQVEDGLRTMRIDEFIDVLASEAPAPGGGSVAALCGALGAALAAMVPNLTVLWRTPRKERDSLSGLAEKAQALKAALVYAIDADTNAFNAFMEARRMPPGPEAKAQLQIANRNVTGVPLGVLEDSVKIFALAKQAALEGNQNALSDAGVSALCAYAAAEGAYYNVLINLNGTKGDEKWVTETRARAAKALEAAAAGRDELAALVRTKLEAGA